MDDLVLGTGEWTPADFLAGVASPDGSGSEWLETSAWLAVDTSSGKELFWIEDVAEIGSFAQQVISDPTYHIDGDLLAPLDYSLLLTAIARDTIILETFGSIHVPLVDGYLASSVNSQLPDNESFLSESTVIWFQYSTDPEQWAVALHTDVSHTIIISDEMIAQEPVLADVPEGVLTITQTSVSPHWYATSEAAAIALAEMIADVQPVHSPCAKSITGFTVKGSQIDFAYEENGSFGVGSFSIDGRILEVSEPVLDESTAYGYLGGGIFDRNSLPEMQPRLIPDQA